MKCWLKITPLALFLLLINGCSRTEKRGKIIHRTEKVEKVVRLLTREVSLGKRNPGIIVWSLSVSPDSKHVAYVAKRGE